MSFLIAGTGLGLILIALGAWLFDAHYVAYFTYAAILLLGFVQNINFGARAFSEMGASFFLTLLAALTLSASVCVAVEYGLHGLLDAQTASAWGGEDRVALQVVACFGAYFFFVLGLWGSALLMKPTTPFAKRIFLYFWNGGYFTRGRLPSPNPSVIQPGVSLEIFTDRSKPPGLRALLAFAEHGGGEPFLV